MNETQTPHPFGLTTDQLAAARTRNEAARAEERQRAIAPVLNDLIDAVVAARDATGWTDAEIVRYVKSVLRCQGELLRRQR